MFSYLKNASRRASSQSLLSQGDQRPRDEHVSKSKSRANLKSITESGPQSPSRLFSSAISSTAPVLPPIQRVVSQNRWDDGLLPGGDYEEDDRMFSESSAMLEKVQRSGIRAGPTPMDSSAVSVPHSQRNPQDASRFSMPPPTRPPPPRPEPIMVESEKNSSYNTTGVQRPLLSDSNKVPSSQGSASSRDDVPQSPLTEIRPYDQMPDTLKPQRPRSRLNRLNPMSLLARRRGTHPVQDTPSSSLPDDYDPRIKGKLVHDFSAPKPAEQASVPASRLLRKGLGKGTSWQALDASKGQEPQDSQSPVEELEKRHTAIFKEHFEEDLGGWRLNPADRRNQSTTGILERMPVEESSFKHSPFPAFARSFPEDVSNGLPIMPFFAPSKPLLDPITESIDAQIKQPLTPPQPHSSPFSPPKTRSRAPSNADNPFQGAGVPVRLKSSSSRFSFDLAGVGSAAQEKLLEDRHRQRYGPRARSRTLSDVDLQGDEFDDFDDNIDYDDDLEEEIPGMSSDEYNYPLNGPGALSNLTLSDNLHAHPEPQDSSETGDTPGMQGYEDDEECYPGGIMHASDDKHTHARPAVDLGITNSIMQLDPPDDDLYFDDGMIEDVNADHDGEFDENVFDDETSKVYGLPLRDQKPTPATIESSEPSTRPTSAESGMNIGVIQAGATGDTSRASVQVKDGQLAVRKLSIIGGHTDSDYAAELTQENLAAYHNALAFAANRAVLDGRFDRKISHDESIAQSSMDVPIQRHISFHEPWPVPSAPDANIISPMGTSMGADFSLEDDEDEDDIIAAANAEALENDDDGFYGQEFGFYARTNGSSEAQYFNGGYLGPDDTNKVKRSHSGRVDFQEPSLTPITERSEWSQRNSMISLAVQPGPYTSPSLAQLAVSGHHDDEHNMNLSALMALRRGWASSSTSLNSSGGTRNTSPSPYAQPVSSQGYSNTNMHFGFAHTPSYDDHRPMTPQLGPVFTYQQPTPSLMGPPPFPSASTNSMPPPLLPASMMKNPLLTLQTQNLALHAPLYRPKSRDSAHSASPHAAVPLSPAFMNNAANNPQGPPLRRAAHGRGHSRNSSGAESVSYRMEKDEDGASVWVVEKRWTNEEGDVEVLGREVLEGRL